MRCPARGPPSPATDSDLAGGGGVTARSAGRTEERPLRASPGIALGALRLRSPGRWWEQDLAKWNFKDGSPFRSGGAGARIRPDDQRQFLKKKRRRACPSIFRCPLQPRFSTRSSSVPRDRLAMPGDMPRGQGVRVGCCSRPAGRYRGPAERLVMHRLARRGLAWELPSPKCPQCWGWAPSAPT